MTRITILHVAQSTIAQSDGTASSSWPTTLRETHEEQTGNQIDSWRELSLGVAGKGTERTSRRPEYSR